jgi:inorganic pyrophosphatase
MGSADSMVRVLIEVEAGSMEKTLYDEDHLECKGTRRVSLAYPFPYGFIVDTHSGDGEAVDCYILTSDPLKAGTIVDCEPVGLLEQTEDEEIDHKVLAIIPGQTVDLDQGLEEKLRKFVYGGFLAFPNTCVHVGRILSREIALEYVRKHR